MNLDSIEEILRTHEINYYGKAKSDMTPDELEKANEKDAALKEKRRDEENQRSLQARQQRNELALRKTGVPNRYFAVELSAMTHLCDKEKKALDRCRKYLNEKEYERGTCLLFLGTAGAGKTMTGCAIANKAA